MLIAIGTRSIPKITAITRAFSRYPELWINTDNKIEYTIPPKEIRNDTKSGQESDIFSGVSCNPMSLSETLEGAKTRAKNAFEYAKEYGRHMQFRSRFRSTECMKLKKLKLIIWIVVFAQFMMEKNITLDLVHHLNIH